MMHFENEILADDVWIGILYFMKTEGGENRFSTDPEIIHSAIYELRKKDEFKDMLNKFVFDTRGFYPRSQTLENSINHLQLAGLLERTNPRFSFFEIKDSTNKYFKEDLENLFNEQQKEQLKKMAIEFAKMVE